MIGVKHTRLTVVGNILDSPGYLHWLIIFNPDSSARHCILNDAISGTDNDVAKFLTPKTETKVYSFSPPIQFNVGIRIGTIEDGDTIITAGYSP